MHAHASSDRPADSDASPEASIFYLSTDNPQLTTYDAHNGGNENFLREYSGGRSETIAGFQVLGRSISDILAANFISLSPYEKEGVLRSLCLRVTLDADFHAWIRYNAHLNGPVGACLNNFISHLQKLDPNMIDCTQDAVRVSTHLYNGEYQPNCSTSQESIYFKVQMPYSRLLSYTDASGTAVQSIENADGTPILTYIATIKAQKDKQGRICTFLTEEMVICNNAQLSDWCKEIEKRMLARQAERMQFKAFKQDLSMQLSNFAIDAPRENVVLPSRSPSSFAFFSEQPKQNIDNIDTAFDEIIELLERIEAQYLVDPLNFNFKQQGVELVHLLAGLKLKYFSSLEKTPQEKAFANILENIVSDWRKVYLPATQLSLPLPVPPPAAAAAAI